MRGYRKFYHRGPSSDVFLIDEGERNQIPLQADNHRPARRFAGVPLKAQLECCLGTCSFVIFQRIRTSIAKKP